MLAASILILGLYDQSHAASETRQSYKHERDWDAVRDAVAAIEGKLPPQTSIYQLPVTGFPLDWDHGEFKVYDHARPYLFSRNLKWSWPALSATRIAWENELSLASPAELAERLAICGFRDMGGSRRLCRPRAVTGNGIDRHCRTPGYYQ